MMVTNQRQPLADESSGASWGEVIRDYTLKSGARWRNGRPNYRKVNKVYFDERSSAPIPGSPEELVTKIIKNWEVDCRHVSASDWRSMDTKIFRASVNGGTKVGAEFMADVGHANLLLQESALGYSMAQHTAESSIDTFSSAFPEGFAWEVLEMFSGPPKVNFKWRHFGKFVGHYDDSRELRHEGDGRLVEVFGYCTVTLSEQHKISEIEVFYNPNHVTEPLMRGEARKVGNKSALGKLLLCCGGQTERHDATQDVSNMLAYQVADAPVFPFQNQSFKTEAV